jgi:hypothetical protein
MLRSNALDAIFELSDFPENTLNTLISKPLNQNQ